ncbi:MAG: porin [Cyclobacteriaceae bacterium]|nr:porin [Cyclobacteriaceae bacterium]
MALYQSNNHRLIVVLFIVFSLNSYSQDSTKTKSIVQNQGSQSEKKEEAESAINFSGYLDVYYGYDFGLPDNERQVFLFNHNRHNQFNINLALIKMELKNPKYRANLALQAGTYAVDNYAAEYPAMRSINEANVGISLNNENNLWLDVGIFPSNLGFESYISMDNWTLTRSLVAECSPYFLSGAKVTYTPNESLEIVGLVSNGWQRIRRVQGNSLLSFGTQVTYHLNEKIMVNWSTFLGTEDPDNNRRIRVFHDFYGTVVLSEKISFLGGIDFGSQQETPGASVYEGWVGLTGILKYKIDENWSVAGRMEYYQDENEVIVSINNPGGFVTNGVSANIDYLPSQNIGCRLEGRLFSSKYDLFMQNGNPVNSNFFFMASMAIKINN